MKEQLILLLLLLIHTPLLTQTNPQPHFRNYSTEDGLPSPSVFSVFEDSKGYMWFGTSSGVTRFDGYHIKNYGLKDGLTSTTVFDIYEDSNNTKWFGTMSGKSFLLKNDTIIPYKYNSVVDGFKGKFSSSTLAHLSKNGTALIELYNFGFLEITADGKIDTIQSPPFSSLIINKDDFRRTRRTANQGVKIKDYYAKRDSFVNSNFFTIDIINNNHRFKKSFPKKRGHFTSSQFDAQKLPSGELLIFKKPVFHCLLDTTLLWSIPFTIKTNEIIAEADGGIWLCLTAGNGLRYYKNLEALKQNKFQTYLKGYTISDFYKDSKGNYWITTLEKGIFYTSNFDLLKFDQQTGFDNDLISSVAFKNKEEIFVGLKNGAIYHLNPNNGEIFNHFLNYFKGYLHDLYYDVNSRTLYDGFFSWKDNTWHLAYDKKEDAPYTVAIKKLYPLSDTILIGLVSRGFKRLNIATNVVDFSSSGIIHKRTTGFLLTPNNKTFVSTPDGLMEYKDSSFITSTVDHPAFHHRINDLEILKDGTICLASMGYGLILWKDGDIVEITEDDGLTLNMLGDIHVDESGQLWVATMLGLNKITIDKKGEIKVRQFTIETGLPSNEIYQIKSHQGQVWLCTGGGLVKFVEHPKNSNSTPPILQAIKVNETPINLSSKAEFSYHENNFEINYLTINYRQSGKIPYRYRLKENNNWQSTQNLNVNFAALAPDDYQFEVQSQNEDGYWSDSSTFAFSILPPWWETNWFRVLGLTVLGLLSYGFYKFRIGQIQKENLFTQEITKLEKSALQAQMNPHFIFNCLNSIQNFILKNDKKKAVEYLSRFATLVRHNLNASVKGLISLEEEITLLENYLALERERFEQRFDYKINITPNLKQAFIEFPPMLIQPYVENAVIHGLRKEEGGGQISLDFSRKNGEINVMVKDNGVGYRENGDGKTTARHKSIGMTVTKKRLALLNNRDAVTITPLMDEQNKPIGTQVNIMIKIKTKTI